MELTLVSQTTELPITLADAKRHLAISTTAHDALIKDKVRAAAEYCAGRIPGHRQLMKATYDALRSAFADEMILPLPPLSDVTSVKYLDNDGTQQTLSSTRYTVLTPSEDPGRIVLGYNQSWPAVRSQVDAITIRFVAGSTTADDVPETLKEAVRLKTEHLFDPARVDEKQINEATDRLLAGNHYGHYG